MITGCDNRDICLRPETLIKRPFLALLLLTMLTGMVGSSARADVVISNRQPMIDFGCVGMDFKIFSNLYIVNTGTAPVKVKSINVPCSCSAITFADSTVRAGDSVLVRLTFDTKNLYGKTIRSFTINTSDPRTPTVEYVYHSLVGQWAFGLRPDPMSLFFLPSNTEKRLIIPNPALENVMVSLVDQADSFYTIKILNPRVIKGGKAEIVATVHGGIKAGTYLSSFRLALQVPEGKEPILMTIPMRIVRY